MTKQNKIAVGYLRVSSKGQIKGHGFARQKDEIQADAKKNGYKIIHWYKEAYTGTEEDRPEFIRMVEDRKPFGYYPGEAETIKRMKQLYRKPHGEKRLGFYQIATILINEGLSTRKGTLGVAHKLAPFSNV